MQQAFINCVAINNILPTLLVIFATFVGFCDGIWTAALGMHLWCDRHHTQNALILPSLDFL